MSHAHEGEVSMSQLERLVPWVRRFGAALLFTSVACGCSSKPVDDAVGGNGGGEGGDSGGGNGDSTRDGTALEFDVPEGERVYVSLATARVVDSDGTGLDWDLAFEGYGVYTNGGLSGRGGGGSFGPLSAPTFLSDTAPQVPLLVLDEAGGVFVRWYAYDDGHVLRSRFHVYGFRDGDRYYKLQLLSYYGDRQGAPLAAMYSLRYAEVTEDGVSSTRVVTEIDATEETSDSECLNLETGERPRLTPGASALSDDWHLCFRRDTISVNGGSIGPRGVGAVDLDAASTETERIADVRKLTAESELPRFDAVDYGVLSNPELAYRLDGVRSAFTDRWLVPGADPPEPENSTWYVVGADGKRYLLTFDGFTGATAASPGRVALRVKAVR